ncbi:MAG: hypothetical protein HOP33_15255 [Verrucomicrobia bacterium]|nr:hypothetical protein [Verrucomicrobiota bacterium]
MFTLLRPGTGALQTGVFIARDFIWQQDDYPASTVMCNEKHRVCGETHSSRRAPFVVKGS